MANELQEKQLSATNQFQVKLIGEIEKTAQEIGTSFTDYGKRCMVNAYAALISQMKSQGISFNDVDGAMLRLAFQNVGYTELNFAAQPSECYFDFRKFKDANGVYHYTVAIKPQGAGNEKLVRKYGVQIRNLLPCWLIREGDEYTLPYWDGTTMTQPTWRPKGFDNKVIMVIYPLEKTNGRTEYLIATRESIKPNIVSQIRQNGLYAFKDSKQRDEFYRQLDEDAEKCNVDELIRLEKYREFLSPTYLSYGAREQMIIRKMQNNALKNYPKEYDSNAIREAVENMYEDNDDSLKEKAAVFDRDVVATVEKEVAEESKEPPVADFEVKEDGTVDSVESKEEKTEQKSETVQENNTVSENDEKKSHEEPSDSGDTNYEDMI